MIYDIVAVVPTYNSAKFLKETLDSLLIQKFNGKWIILITDDFSTDNTKDIIKDYYSKFPNKIKCRFNKKNLGIGKNIFTAFKIYETKYIFTFSGDDLIIDDYFFQKQFNILENDRKLSLSYFDGYRFYDNDRNSLLEALKFKPNSKFDIDYWIDNHFFTINHQSFFFRQEFLPEFSDWMLNSVKEDWLLLFMLLQKGDAAFTDEKVSLYRLHNHSTTSKGYDVKNVLGGLKLIKNINRYTNYKYKVKFGSNNWRYERLAFAYYNEKHYFKALTTSIIFFLMKNNRINKINFLKTWYRLLILKIKPQF